MKNDSWFHWKLSVWLHICTSYSSQSSRSSTSRPKKNFFLLLSRNKQMHVFQNWPVPGLNPNYVTYWCSALNMSKLLNFLSTSFFIYKVHIISTSQGCCNEEDPPRDNGYSVNTISLFLFCLNWLLLCNICISSYKL